MVKLRSWTDQCPHLYPDLEAGSPWAGNLGFLRFSFLILDENINKTYLSGGEEQMSSAACEIQNWPRRMEGAQ